MDNECHANICVFVQNSPDPPPPPKSVYINAFEKAKSINFILTEDDELVDASSRS